MKRKKAAAKKAKRIVAPKTRNAQTMSESAFWSFIRSALRQKSRWWKPILNVKRAAQIPYKGSNKRRKYLYVCGECGKPYPGDQVNVHHRVECGSLRCAEDLPGFVNRLFCESKDLILLCQTCHTSHHEKLKTETK